jgi:hypothetical protein
VTGELRWMRDVAGMVEDEERELTSLASYIRDITAAKRRELSLRESNERQRRRPA